MTGPSDRHASAASRGHPAVLRGRRSDNAVQARRPAPGTGCDTCAARAPASLCGALGPADLALLFPTGARMTGYRAGGTVFRQGEPFDRVLLVRSGWAMTVKAFEDGRRQILRFALPGALLGFEGDAGAGMPCGAEAITDLTVCAIPRGRFLDACAASPPLALAFAQAVGREAVAAWNRLGDVGQRPARERIAALLLELHRRVEADGAGRTFLPISQVHIADATGLTPVHVCRCLKRMREDRMLEFHKGRLVLRAPDRLARLAPPEPEPGLAEEAG